MCLNCNAIGFKNSSITNRLTYSRVQYYTLNYINDHSKFDWQMFILRI